MPDCLWLHIAAKLEFLPKPRLPPPCLRKEPIVVLATLLKRRSVHLLLSCYGDHLTNPRSPEALPSVLLGSLLRGGGAHHSILVVVKCGSSPCWSSCRSEVPFNPCRYQNLALLILRVSLVILPSHRETLLTRDVIVTNYYLCQCNSPRPDRITMREFGKLFIGLAKLDYHSGSRSQP